MKICVYGASSAELEQVYFDEAFALGAMLAKAGHSLIFGGGNSGLMGSCARGAASEGGEIIGIAPRFFDEPGILFPECTEFIFTETMSERKKLMEDSADAFIILPGGIGTYEEFFETLTLKQLGQHDKPMALMNTNAYYSAMNAMLEHTVSAGFMGRSCLELFAICQSPSEAVAHIESDVRKTGSIRRIVDYSRQH